MPKWQSLCFYFWYTLRVLLPIGYDPERFVDVFFSNYSIYLLRDAKTQSFSAFDFSPKMDFSTHCFSWSWLILGLFSPKLEFFWLQRMIQVLINSWGHSIAIENPYLSIIQEHSVLEDYSVRMLFFLQAAMHFSFLKAGMIKH